MRSRCRTLTCASWLLLLAACASAVPAAQDHAAPKVRRAPSDLTPVEEHTVELYRQSLPTVVMILTTTAGKSGGSELAVSGLGTGVLIAPDCHVLTAAHVVDGADKIVVKTQDGVLRPAQLIFSEPGADIALLQLMQPDDELPHAPLGDSDRMAVGQRLYIIGNPQGLENSFSSGLVSGFRNQGWLYDGTIAVEFIQTDAAINSGNSGGPVFDSQGRVVGIASRILTQSGGSEGLGFVVAINTAKQLLALEDRTWTGMQGMFLNSAQLGLLLNLDLPGGLLLQQVAANSPAQRAGLRGGVISARIGPLAILLGGDLILEFGGQDACHSTCLAAAHDHISHLDRIPVTYLRGGKILKTELDVSETHRTYLSEEDRNEGR